MVFLIEFFEKDDFEEKKSEVKTHEKLPSMQIVDSSHCNVNLGLAVGDLKCAILLVGLCHVQSCHCIGQLLSGDFLVTFWVWFGNNF